MQSLQFKKPKKLWLDKITNFEDAIPYYITRIDSTKVDYDPVVEKQFRTKEKWPGLYDWMHSQTMQGKFDQYCLIIKDKGFDTLTHEDRIFISAFVVAKPNKAKGKGVLHSKQNINKLLEAGYPAHLCNPKFGHQEKMEHMLKLAMKNPEKIPFDLTKKDSVRFPDGKGDMNQFLKDNIIGGARGPSEAFKKLLNKVAPKWVLTLEEHNSKHTANAKKENKRDVAVKKLLDLTKIRPRVGADKHGGGFNKQTIDYTVTKWFKALSKSKPKEFAEIQKQAPWWFGYTKREMSYPAVCPYGGRHGARKLDLLDYARKKQNKIYRFGLSKKAKTDTDVWMKSVFTYCTSSRKKNGYDKKFHKELIAIRPEVEKLFPL
jgi:hypothetical protein